MIIDGDTIIWKSYHENYRKEEAGIKSNTVRFLTEIERADLMRVRDELRKIRIVNTQNMLSFTRDLTDIHFVKEVHEATFLFFAHRILFPSRRYCYVFSWRHEKVMEER